jgi:glycosyltransferase involved in cell wall biosynthesis
VIEAEIVQKRMEDQIASLSAQVRDAWAVVLDRDKTLNEIYRSRGWHLLKILWRIKARLFPPNSFREHLGSLAFHTYHVLRYEGIGAFLRKVVCMIIHSRFVRWTFGWLIPGRFKEFYRSYREEYPFIDRTQVVLYASQSVLPGYSPRSSLESPSAGKNPIRVTLISTARNEAVHAKSWLDSLLLQSRMPDEVVITDGGSSDGTAEIVRNFARSAPFPVQMIEIGEANISRGRNIAIQNASHPIIACSDFGCILDKDWLRNLLVPFEADHNVELSAGFYEPLPGTDFQNLAGSFFIPEVESIKPQNFLPSGRSVAMKKTLWARSGGYPEFLTHSGEDTLFDYQAKKQGGVWAFVPQAKVAWRVVPNYKRLANTCFRYARGDGEVGILAPAYWNKTCQVGWFFFWLFTDILISILSILLFPRWGWLVPVGIVLWIGIGFFRWIRATMASRGFDLRSALIRNIMDMVISYNQFRGFFAGVRNRPCIKQREIETYTDQLQKIVTAHPDRKGIIVFPPTHDWGFMFQRPHQMARAFARRGYLFFFHVYNLNTDAVIGFQKVEPNLYICFVPMETFRVLDSPVVYIGSPWHRRTLEAFNHPVVVYDHYDDLAVWNARQEDHQYLLQNAKVVMATARGLLEKAQVFRPDILLAPNAVDYDFIQCFRPSPADVVPDDLQPILASGKPIIGYSGALAEWFDYGLVRDAAQANPGWEFVLIGVNYDHSLDRSGLLECGLANLHWLGMKPYNELFRYVWRFDVAIIPFKVNEITLATSPIKMFEYMACAKPVVSTGLPECRDYPGVFIAETPDQFIEHLHTALRAGKDEAYLHIIDQVARQNTWNRRVDAILARLETVIGEINGPNQASSND